MVRRDQGLVHQTASCILNSLFTLFSSGSWCPSPADCSVLKTCINDEIASAKSANKKAYQAYLEPGKVTNHLDFESCGKSREYFGFDALYKVKHAARVSLETRHNIPPDVFFPTLPWPRTTKTFATTSSNSTRPKISAFSMTCTPKGPRSLRLVALAAVVLVVAINLVTTITLTKRLIKQHGRS